MSVRCAVAILILVVCASAPAEPKPPPKPPSGWRLYSGAWFDIVYPQSFTPIPMQKSKTSATGADPVAFSSPSRDVEFYVFSPQWAGRASALDIDSRRERLTSKKVTQSDNPGGPVTFQKNGIEDTWLGISALDGSYVRFVHHQYNDVFHTTLAFGIKCKDMATYRRYKTDYDRFRKSLVQYAD